MYNRLFSAQNTNKEVSMRSKNCNNGKKTDAKTSKSVKNCK